MQKCMLTRKLFIMIIVCLVMSCSKGKNDNEENTLQRQIKEIQLDLVNAKSEIEKIYITDDIYPNIADSHSIEDAYIIVNNEKTYLRNMQYKFPVDPFDKSGKKFKYYYFPDNQCYIISSNGPDLDNDIEIALDPENIKKAKDIYSLISPILYNVSNGIKSNGDIAVYGP